MLVQQQNPSVEHGAPTFVGEYYEACKVYARENEDEVIFHWTIFSSRNRAPIGLEKIYGTRRQLSKGNS